MICLLKTINWICFIIALIEWVEIYNTYRRWGLTEAQNRFLKATDIPADANPNLQYMYHLIFTWCAAIGCTVVLIATFFFGSALIDFFNHYNFFKC